MTNFALTKKELRQTLGVSATTLNRWLNVLYYEQLKPHGYRKCQRIFSHRQKLIIEKLLVIVPD